MTAKEFPIPQLPLAGDKPQLISVTQDLAVAIPPAAFSILRLISEFAGYREPFMAGHGEKVASMAIKLAASPEIGFEANRLKLLWYGAIFHDVGKFGVSTEIMNLPRALTEDEYEQVKAHTLIGQEILMDIGLDTTITNVARHHHERYDGSGYPDGLQAEEIPLEARIVSVADVYDALTSQRSYRKAFSHSEAIRIMEDEEDYYDPMILNEFIELLNENQGNR